VLVRMDLTLHVNHPAFSHQTVRSAGESAHKPPLPTADGVANCSAAIPTGETIPKAIREEGAMLSR
jgi:hypothetical protein